MIMTLPFVERVLRTRRGALGVALAGLALAVLARYTVRVWTGRATVRVTTGAGCAMY
jgi:hypothetical protein